MVPVPSTRTYRGGGRELALFVENFGFAENFGHIYRKISVLYVLQYIVGTCYTVPAILRKFFAENFGFDEVPDASGTFYHVL